LYSFCANLACVAFFNRTQMIFPLFQHVVGVPSEVIEKLSSDNHAQLNQLKEQGVAVRDSTEVLIDNQFYLL